MNWTLLADHLAAKHGSDYQSIYKVRVAVRQCEEGLIVLGQLGHHYHLEKGPPPPQQEWPKYMFHERCPDGLLVHGPEEAQDLGDGWRPSLAEARQAHGLRMQFAGRGGVKLTDLPAVILGQDAEGQKLTREERILSARNALEQYWATLGQETESAIEKPKAASANGSSKEQPPIRKESRGATVSS
jgi:hypothetical protein